MEKPPLLYYLSAEEIIPELEIQCLAVTRHFHN